MSFTRRAIPLAVGVLIVGAIVAFLSRGLWFPVDETPASADAETTGTETNATNTKIIVGDQAQANLGLTAKQLKADVFWKTITVQGIVVDRPGRSERQVVAPTTGIVTEIVHVPGDAVWPGDVLFHLKLSSDVVHQTQTDLFKTSQEIKLAQARLERLVAAGDGVPQVRLIEVESEIARLEATVKSCKHELLIWGLSDEDVEGVANGKLVTDIPIKVPPVQAIESTTSTDSASARSATFSQGYELQRLDVEAGEQVQAGDPLCLLSNHQMLAIEGRAFRDETVLLERSIEQGWPVEVDFQEDAVGDWPSIDESFAISHLVNVVDPVTRTFSFFVPLENQSKLIERGGRTQLLWRFRPGQKVRLYVRVEESDDVFVLPADAVVREGAEAFVFTQNVNTFERIPVHVLFHDRDEVVLANDGSLPTYAKGEERWTVAAIVRNAAAQLNRMAKAGSSEVPKGYHIHADGSLHKNEDEGK